MRIESIELRHVRIPFKRAFQHATKERNASDAVIIALRDEKGRLGHGEVLPRPYLTGESIESVLERDGPELAERWAGRSLTSRAELVEFARTELDLAAERLAVFSGFEVALLDLGGRAFDFPAGDVLGRPPGHPLPAGVVVGFEISSEKLERYCATLRMAGRKHVKLKVGLPDDHERADTVLRVLEPEGGLRLDANGIWSADEAIEHLRALSDLRLASIEQPVSKDDVEGLRRVREATGLAVMADESLCSLEDARSLLAGDAVDIFNIRLGKCGGFLGSLRLAELAAEKGLSCHLGTLVGETGILSRAAEIFGARVEGFACLEGKGQNHFLLDQDVLHEHATSEESPGLGIEVSQEQLDRLTVSPPSRFQAGKGAVR